MKIRKVASNRRRRMFEIVTYAGHRYAFPFAKSEPTPTVEDPVSSVYPDPEFGQEAFTYTLASGAEGCVHIDHVLEYNEDPGTIRHLLVHKLGVEAKARLERSPLSVREIARRLGTSPAQVYRLVALENSRKSIDKLVELLTVLDCDVDLVIKPKAA